MTWAHPAGISQGRPRRSKSSRAEAPYQRRLDTYRSGVAPGACGSGGKRFKLLPFERNCARHGFAGTQRRSCPVMITKCLALRDLAPVAAADDDEDDIQARP